MPKLKDLIAEEEQARADFQAAKDRVDACGDNLRTDGELASNCETLANQVDSQKAIVEQRGSLKTLKESATIREKARASFDNTKPLLMRADLKDLEAKKKAADEALAAHRSKAWVGEHKEALKAFEAASIALNNAKKKRALAQKGKL